MIEFYLTVSLFCVGLHVIMNGEGMIGNDFANFFSTYQPEYLTKPLYECLSCMASIWTFVFWFGTGKTFGWGLLVAMIVVCGLNTLARVILKPIYDVE